MVYSAHTPARFFPQSSVYQEKTKSFAERNPAAILRFALFSRMLKNSASSGKAEVEAKMKKVRSSLNRDLDLPQTLRPC